MSPFITAYFGIFPTQYPLESKSHTVVLESEQFWRSYTVTDCGLKMVVDGSARALSGAKDPGRSWRFVGVTETRLSRFLLRPTTISLETRVTRVCEGFKQCFHMVLESSSTTVYISRPQYGPTKEIVLRLLACFITSALSLTIAQWGLGGPVRLLGPDWPIFDPIEVRHQKVPGRPLINHLC